MLFKNTSGGLEKAPVPEGESKDFGKDVDIHAYFIRHGEKKYVPDDPDTPLTDIGRRQARVFGGTLDSREAIKGYSSRTVRTEDTVENIIEASRTEHKLKARVRDELSFEWDKKGSFFPELVKLRNEGRPANYKQLPENERKKIDHDIDAKITDWYLNFGEKRPDKGTESPVELAAKVAHRIATYQKMARRLSSGSSVDLINGTHDFPIAAFLQRVIVRSADDKKVVGFHSVNEIGGPIEYTENFELVIHNDKEGNQKMQLKFRGQSYEIDMEHYNELLNAYEKSCKTKQDSA
ncbi:MAG: histidine phosphatase family protein [Patescibacteria group bacterium]